MTGLPLMAAAMATVWAVSEAAVPNSIEVKDFMFMPTTLTVNAGDDGDLGEQGR